MLVEFSGEQFAQIVAPLIFLRFLVKFYLARRQENYVWNKRQEVPLRFQEKVSAEDHFKAASYTQTKLRFERLFLAYETLILWFWTLGGGLSRLCDIINSLYATQSSILFGLLFIFCFGIIEFVLSLPATLTSTFYIEEKFGFNKTDAKTFIIDALKQLLVSILLGGPLIAGLIFIMERLQSNWFWVGQLFLMGIQLLMMLIYPKFIAPLFNKFTPLEDEELKKKIFSLLDKAGFKSDGIFVMDASKRSSHGNAYFTGIGKNKRIVFFDNLIKNLTHDETIAVLAHELGHFKKKHVLKMMVISWLFSFSGLFILSFLQQQDWFYEAFKLSPQLHPLPISLLLFSMITPLMTYFMAPLMTLYSRKCEYEADEFASQHASPQKLIDALVKLYKENASTLTPDPLYVAIYHSHPSAIERIHHLEKLALAK